MPVGSHPAAIDAPVGQIEVDSKISRLKVGLLLLL